MSIVESIPISALQHYSFCPRQCAYIHMEQRWEENYLTAKGKQLHDRVHGSVTETRGKQRTERGVRVQSLVLGIHGQLDLLEIQYDPYILTPVEYKKGQTKVADCDRIQLCAQALVPGRNAWYSDSTGSTMVLETSPPRMGGD